MARTKKIREDKKRIGRQVSMSRKDWDEVDSLADHLGMTRSEMVRRALGEYRGSETVRRALEKCGGPEPGGKEAAEA